MHTPECLDGNDFWPIDYAEVAATTIPLKTTDPNTWTALKLSGEGNWLGVSGNFFGVRISNTTRRNATTGNAVSYPIGKNFVVPWPSSPSGVLDVLLCAETPGAVGLPLFGRFKTEATARNWCAAMDAGGLLFNDRTGFFNPPRQPDSFVNQSNFQSAISIASTGVKASILLSSDGWLTSAHVGITTVATGATGKLELQLVRSAVTYILGPGGLSTNPALLASGVGNVVAYMRDYPSNGSVTVPAASMPPVPLLSGDTVQFNVSVAFATGAADLHLGVKRERSAAF